MITLPNYRVEFFFDEKKANINLQLLTSYVNTNNLLHTYSFFEKYLPKILLSKCFNELNLPFYIEIRNTELGHLFEHILLEKLCENKLKAGKKTATFKGCTSWNWKKEPFGLFHIEIELNNSDVSIFNQSVLDSCKLFTNLLSLADFNSQEYYINYEKDFEFTSVLDKYPVNA